MTADARSPFAPLFTLDPSVDYLNHGSFGACPRPVLELQTELRRRLEREPMDFLVRELPRLLDAARASLAAFLGADPADLVFVPNATAGVNAVVRSLDLGPGNELLTTTHAYAACRKTLDYVARRSGAVVVAAEVPFPLRSEDEVVEPVLAAVSPATRLALIDHVTSPTALVFPVERLVRELRARGVETLVDGAHAPGTVPLALDALGAAAYTGNAHKWLCAPKGAAFLHVRRDRQRDLHPTAISHGYEPSAGAPRFHAEFDWTGTADPTPFLCVPAAIELLGSLLPGGWPALMERNRALALKARDLVCSALGVEQPAPDSLLASLASVPLPAPRPGSPAATLGHDGLMDWFRARGVESWSYPWPCGGGKVIRVSAQIYNTRGQFERLARLSAEAVGRG